MITQVEAKRRILAIWNHFKHDSKENTYSKFSYFYDFLLSYTPEVVNFRIRQPHIHDSTYSMQRFRREKVKGWIYKIVGYGKNVS